MLCALIMAGGKGTRFWPLSTEEKPKQFLNLVGDRTMLQMTVERIKEVIPEERIFVSSCEAYKNLIKEQLPNLADRNIIIEPEGRNTAPCIALSTLVINRYYKDVNLIVLPSDHLINNEDLFREIIVKGDKFIDKNKEALLTLGMTPSSPETGYGYIKYKKDCNNKKDGIIKVDAFVEKPDKNTAEKYLSSGNYLWNGGIFMWNIENILSKIRLYMPDAYEALNSIREIKEENLQEFINDNYSKTESISIDYAVLEKDKDIYVIPTEVGWDDIGSWNAVERYKNKDKYGNILMGEAISIDSLNNILVSKNKKVVVNNISDIYVLEGENEIIIGKKNEIDKVKNIKESIGL